MTNNEDSHRSTPSEASSTTTSDSTTTTSGSSTTTRTGKSRPSLIGLRPPPQLSPEETKASEIAENLILDFVKREEAEYDEYRKRYQPSSLATSLALLVVGGGLSYAGFRYGFSRQLRTVAREENVIVSQEIVGPSGIPARKLAMQALARGSALAIVGSSVLGVAFAMMGNYYTDKRWRERGGAGVER